MSEEAQVYARSAVAGATSPSAGQPAESQLEGHMGVFELAFSVLAFSAPVAVVSGFVPFVIIFQGSGAPSAFLIAMALLLLFSVGYTTMTRYLPNPGAFYAYITAGLNRPLGLGASFLAITGYMLLAVGTYMFLGIAANALVVGTFSGPDVSWWVYALASIALTGIMGYLRIDLSAKVLSVAMVAEVIIVLVFDLAVFGKGGAQWRSLEPFSPHAITSGSVGIAVLFAATCFLGFEATAIFRDEVRDPGRTVPRATYLAVGFIGIFYIFAAWMLVTAFGHSKAPDVANADPVGMFGSAVNQFVGKWAVDMVSILLVTSLLAALLSVQNILARYLFSLGGDRVLPTVLGKVHPRNHSPFVSSIVITAALATAIVGFALVGSDPALTYSRLAGTGGFCVLVLMFLCSISVIAFFRRHRDIQDAGTWHTVIAPLLSTVGFGVVLFLAMQHFDLLTAGSTTSTIVLQSIVWGMLAAGVVLAVVYSRTRPDTYQRIGRHSLK